MTSTERHTRQYRVTHISTGIVTVVEDEERRAASGKRWRTSATRAATQAGFRYPSDVAVSVVPKGQEIPLPWGCLPLVLRPRVACAS